MRDSLRRHGSLHFFHCLAFDLAYTLGRHAKFIRQIVQRRRIFFGEPARFDAGEVLAERAVERDALRRFASAQGVPGLYHETITWAFVLLIAERLRRSPGTEWETFLHQNPDIFDWKNNILRRYYREKTLNSAEARESFLLPDRLAAQ